MSKRGRTLAKLRKPRSLSKQAKTQAVTESRRVYSAELAKLMHDRREAQATANASYREAVAALEEARVISRKQADDEFEAARTKLLQRVGKMEEREASAA